ncbi:phosphoadenosine phosphosulfate reductase family protein [bacterium]|nr:phosphoadenosine phosphosulfate reductase family protein [bacterium]
MKHRIRSISGGKDSTAVILHGIENELPGRYVFADTGNEHEITLDYLCYLENRLGIKIERIKADFSKRIETRKANLSNTESWVYKNWIEDGWAEDDIANLVELLVPTGIPFLDLAMLKGRFPSTKSAFCSIDLKQIPMRKQIVDPILDVSDKNIIISIQGVRADESLKRAGRSPCEMTDEGIYYQYPIFQWSADDVFAIHKKHGVKPNPLYSMGCGRVGCMPCINVRKDELMNIGHRFPGHVERIAEWEKIVSKVAKQRSSTFLPAIGERNEDAMEKGNIYKQIEWSNTSRGGRQVDLVRSEPPPACSSIYGLCDRG